MVPNGYRVFVDPPRNLSPEHAALFRDFGLEAYTFIAFQEMQEREQDEQAYWDRVKPIHDREDEPDEEIDYGFEEPDDYGE